MDNSEFEEIFKLARLIKKDKEELRDELNEIISSVKQKQESLKELNRLLREAY